MMKSRIAAQKTGTQQHQMLKTYSRLNKKHNCYQAEVHTEHPNPSLLQPQDQGTQKTPTHTQTEDLGFRVEGYERETGSHTYVRLRKRKMTPRSARDDEE
jgi:hypothetical protein